MENTTLREAAADRRQATSDRSRHSFPINITERRALIAGFDLIGAAVGTSAAAIVAEVVTGRDLSIAKFPILYFGIAWVTSLFIVDGYEVQIPTSRVRSLVVVLKATPVAGVLGALFFFIQPYRITRPSIVLAVVFGSALILGLRLSVARLLLHEAFAMRALLVGGARPNDLLDEAIALAKFSHRLVGAVGDPMLTPCSELPRLGDVDDLLALVGANRAKMVIVGEEDADTQRAVETCVNNGIRMIPYRSLIETYGGRIPLSGVDTPWFMALPQRELSTRVYLVLRRTADLLLSIAILTPSVLLLPLVAAAIRLEGSGPVFLRQTRVGQHGREFTLYKLRTMMRDAESTGHMWTQPGDPRITRVGHLLRLTRLDELPQILNVLRGEMSFIGPRPERPEFVRELERELPHYRARLSIKPGISGWAQVKAGYAASVRDSELKLEHDLYYAKNQSLRLDLQIVVHTLFTVLGFRGR